ncbi:50S rRNA methyltransferase [Gammaproteobacteria bacterium]
MVDIDPTSAPFPQSPVVPALLSGDAPLQFRCHPDIACFNACCKNIDISLTPYDILRLRRRLEISSDDFLTRYTIPYEIEKDGLVGVKLRPVDQGTACQFMTEKGCGVYTDRPTACRYYPLALLSIRHQDEYTDRNAFALVQEDHCLGHQESRLLTIDEYRQEQGLGEYDELGRGWRQLILKKKSSGPTVGKPTKRSLQLFFMVCYDLDRFRQFVNNPGFQEVYDLPDDLWQKLRSDDIELMLFGFQFLRQVLFSETSLSLKSDAVDRRLARKQEREAVMDTIVSKVAPAKPAE